MIKAVGPPYNACAGALISQPGLVQGRKGLLLGDDTYVGGFHFIGMETKRLDCLYAPVETPGTVLHSAYIGSMTIHRLWVLLWMLLQQQSCQERERARARASKRERELSLLGQQSDVIIT